MGANEPIVDSGVDYAADVESVVDDVDLDRAVGNFLSVNELLENAKSLVTKYTLEHRQLSEDTLPELFSQKGISSYDYYGKVVDINPVVSAKIKNKDSRTGALNWLRSHGLGHIIKSSITVFFDKGQDHLVGDFKVKAEQAGLSYEQKDSVHGATLKSTIKNYVAQGKTVDSDYISVYVGRKAVIRGQPEKEEDES